MNEFIYTVTDENGIHARPAGLIVKKAQSYDFDVIIEAKGKTESLKKLLALMGMGIKKGDTVRVAAPKGHDISELYDLFKSNI